MTSLPRLAVFDVDGTLIDSQHNIVAAMGLAFRAQGLEEMTATAVRRIIGLSLVEAVARLRPDLPSSRHEAIAQSYKDAFFTLRSRPDHTEPLFPGAAEALALLEADNWLLGIATGKSRRGLLSMIERHGLQGRFVTLQTADGNPGKPHPAMVLQAMSEAGVEAENTVMIGDTSFDMQMARAARARAAGVVWGYHPPGDLLEAGAETMIEDFKGLPVALNALLERR
ncbi:HAD-IA family hydrolase [Telmatospirillum siberiense]|uniref:Haloacid dehalogenase n=1 Tax=Telmatospirillum siberiense TaxID=382514 RepID=A0A2N3PNB9_9PROT|nr:HAD-IA family hydrolase [Telmatospirillum siberiense]PKU21880.1 haloacid dehalogenase [Telmatospirillum siberiense]